MKRKFNLKEALAGAPLVTRDGRKVTLFERDGSLIDFPYRAVFRDGDVRNFSSQGKYYIYGESGLDLFIFERKPKPKEPVMTCGNAPWNVTAAHVLGHGGAGKTKGFSDEEIARRRERMKALNAERSAKKTNNQAEARR